MQYSLRCIARESSGEMEQRTSARSGLLQGGLKGDGRIRARGGAALEAGAPFGGGLYGDKNPTADLHEPRALTELLQLIEERPTDAVAFAKARDGRRRGRNVKR